MSLHLSSKKFSVQSVDDVPLGSRVSVVRDPEGAYAGVPSKIVQEDIEVEDDDEHELDLFEDEKKALPPMSNWFSKLAAYTGGIEPTADETKQLRDKQAKLNERKRLGTFLGVFLPCCQNILGVLLFVRVGWITGVSGTFQKTIIVLMCCSCTFLTALSMSAIATNGKVPAGGSYFMISRSIGPEFGGAVGLLFYFGTTIAGSMYLVGAVEVFLKYACPQASLFGDITLDWVLFNNTRVYGTLLLFFVMCCVFVGIRFVSRFAPFGLVALICSILCLYLGVFTVSPSRSPYVCSLGGRLLSQSFYTVDGVADCSKNKTGPIYHAYCENNQTATNRSCAFFEESEIEYFAAIPGLWSNKFSENFFQSTYREKGQPYDSLDFPPKREYGQGPNIADVTTSFMILLGIYFPSVTGMMAGSNRSGDLANPQVSIPRGTITAILVTSFIYLSGPLLMSAICDGRVMRDKFGESFGGGLLVAEFAWPHSWVVLIGACFSTIGAGLQCLTGSPRLLQAIAKDNVMPVLTKFQVTTTRGEPLRAQLLSYAIAQIGILIAAIDSLTPLITMFFLMCYGFVNLATMLNGFLREPGWRPRFRYYHWSLSLLGLCLCISLMFISSWYYTIVAWTLAGAIYMYIAYRGASKEWGDAFRGLHMSTAKRAILKLGNKPIHPKNWRPQILVYMPLDQDFKPRHSRLLDLVHQLKAGHGLTLVVYILEGDVIERKEDAIKAKVVLNELIQAHRIQGLPEVLVSATVEEGMRNMAQCAGLGSLRHNTLLISFPEDWQADADANGKKLTQFFATIRASQACDLAMLVPKGIDWFPKSKSTPMYGSVDVWYIVHDGGLLLLTSYLLMRNRVWRKCELRIFVVACEGDDTVNLKKDMIKFVYDLRINATVEVVAMSTTDISPYMAQRTMNIEERRLILSQMKLSTHEARCDPQTIVDQHRKSIATNDHIEHMLNGGKNSNNALGGETTFDTVLRVPNVVIVPSQDMNSDDNMEDIGEAALTASDNVTSTQRETLGLITAANKVDPEVKGSRTCTVTFENDVNSPTEDRIQSKREAASDLDTLTAVNNINEYTFSSITPKTRNMAATLAKEAAQITSKQLSIQDHWKKRPPNKRRLHSATRLNELLCTYSSTATLVIVNMPSASRNPGSEYHYMSYIDALTKGLTRVLLVHGTGHEVVTALSE